MKTTLLAILAIGAALAPARLPAQGTVYLNGTVLLNNYDSGMGIYLPEYYGPAPAGTFVEVFGGPTPTTLTPLVNSAGAGPIYTIVPGGVEALGPRSGSYFDAGYGFVPGVPSGGAAFFQILVWYGASNFWAAPYVGRTPVWSQLVGRADNPFPPTPGSPMPLNIPGRIAFMLPEPSTTALAGLGLAGLLAFRCRNERSGREATGHEATQRERKPK